MKFSAWSSLGISVCSALFFASAASAHLSIDPHRVQPREEVELVFSVPNEDDALGVDHVTLGIPAEFELDDAEAKSGWTQSRTGQAITWSGGLVPKGQYARFAVRGTAPPRAETVLFNVLVGDRAGKSITYRVALEVGSAATARAGSSSTAKAALIVAVIAAILATGALVAAASRWARPTRL